MKSDNVFKFVSVRPPKKKETDDMVVIPDDNSIIKEIITELGNITNNKDVSLSEARLIIGEKLFNSDRYFTNNSHWKRFLSLLSEVFSLLKEIQGGLPLEKFRYKAVSILRKIYGEEFTLEKFVPSDEFRALRDSIWTSYYANVLSPMSRPQDRQDIVLWIKFFYLLETIGDEACYARIAAQINRPMPNVPFEFYKTEITVRPHEEPGEENDDETARLKEIKRIRELITKLQTILALLKRLYAEKVKQFQENKNQIIPKQANELTTEINLLRSEISALNKEISGIKLHSQETGTSERQKNNREKEIPNTSKIGGTFFSASADLIRNAPWYLSPDEIEKFKDFLQTLRDVNIDLDAITIPALIYKIEEKIASLEARISELSMREEIVGVGRIFSKVIRPIVFRENIRPSEKGKDETPN